MHCRETCCNIGEHERLLTLRTVVLACVFIAAAAAVLRRFRDTKVLLKVAITSTE